MGGPGVWAVREELRKAGVCLGGACDVYAVLPGGQLYFSSAGGLEVVVGQLDDGSYLVAAVAAACAGRGCASRIRALLGEGRGATVAEAAEAARQSVCGALPLLARHAVEVASAVAAAGRPEGAAGCASAAADAAALRALGEVLARLGSAAADAGCAPAELEGARKEVEALAGALEARCEGSLRAAGAPLSALPRP